ncbi:hypothetical protein [Mycobacteroides abscessus]|uniref:hypothetical protein n=1 Tax=Mycobacteroides abscessus TaxID=36809 RepID=UPI000927C7B2|nr:hypothetical protein [Mycobacteroides abscessus]SHQ27784.1 Uncharacterised protein [Mycobacteroides abscessus subsp. abscessus]SHS96457.1 Uncharacterised protein [Mycobacteroides abscessus subsp. abscessus]SHT27748.1 Uncharacterised protein [Mycobacteroides abscessus subsp. abscessus]SKE76667.1 Uncharacterised protein [Mycobacteroides abscessus subsp. abscessus]SKG27671.1 Uncharacterised protein [Mycobacteroides abscessus subsp. abscessus]
MQINAFVPTEYVTLHGPVANALGLPQIVRHQPPIKEGDRMTAIAPLLLCVSALNGADNDSHIYIKVHDQSGELRGRHEQLWVWDDSAVSPMKWQVFALRMPFVVAGPGVYTFGVYTGPDDGPGQALSSFQIPVILDLQEPEMTFRK